MNTEMPFIVLSSDRADNSPEVNKERRILLEHQLAARGLDFKQVTGVYKGLQEVSYIVLTPKDGDEHACLQLARRYGQESVLLVDANRYTVEALLNEGAGGVDINFTRPLGFWRRLPDYEPLPARYTQDGCAFYATQPAP